MGIFGILPESRSIENPAIPITAEQLAALSSFGPTIAGVQVNQQTALTFTAVFSAVRVISESLGSMQMNVYKNLVKGKELAASMPAHRLLSSQANEYMTSAVFLETFFANLVLWGYAGAKIEFDNAGRAANLLPFQSRNSRPIRIAGAMKFQVTTAQGTEDYDMNEVLYVPGLSLNGIDALSPIAYAREAVAMGKAAEAFGATIFGNGGNVGGILTHPGVLSEKARKGMEESWNRKHQGAGSASKIAVLEEGLKYERIGIPPEDAQFLQTRKFQVNEIARIYRIPPHMLGDLDRSTNNNIEQQSLDFLTNTLATYITKFQQECDAKLLPPGGQYNAIFNTRTLLRGDIKTRMAFYNGGRQWGYLSANDVREMEDLNDIEGGDTYLSPANMTDAAELQLTSGPVDATVDDEVETTPIDSPIAESDDPAADPDAKKDPKGKKKRAIAAPTPRPALPAPAPDTTILHRRLAKSHARLFADASERLVRKEAKAVDRLDKRTPAAFRTAAADFYKEHRTHMEAAYTVPALSLAELAGGGDGLNVELAQKVEAAVKAYVDEEVRGMEGAFLVGVSPAGSGEYMKKRCIERPAAVATELSQKIIEIVENS